MSQAVKLPSIVLNTGYLTQTGPKIEEKTEKPSSDIQEQARSQGSESERSRESPHSPSKKIASSDPVPIKSLRKSSRDNSLPSHLHSVRKSSDQKYKPSTIFADKIRSSSSSLDSSEQTLTEDSESEQSRHSPSKKLLSSAPVLINRSSPRRSPRDRLITSQSHLIKRDNAQTDKPIPTLTVRVPVQLLINAINIPVIPYKEWKKRVIQEFSQTMIKSEISLKSCQLVMIKITEGFLKQSSILQRIEKATELLNGISEYGFLGDFLKTASSFQFREKYIELQAKESPKAELLYTLMGDEEAIKILKCTEGVRFDKLKGAFESEFNTITLSEPKRRSLIKSSFIFREGFDIENLAITNLPIFLVSYANFEESFRSFYSDGPFLENSIRINDENLIIPKYVELGVEDDDRGDYFLKWLISNIQEKMGIAAQIDVAAQAETFSKRPEKLNADRLTKLVTKNFSQDIAGDLSEEEVLSRITALFVQLQQEKGFKEFSDQMSHYSDFIAKHLINFERFKAKDWRLVAVDLLSLYHNVYLLEEKCKMIPSLALLKSMCFSSYATGEMFLRKSLCPDLFDPSNQHCLILDRGVITSYDIVGYNKSFEVKHIRSFKIISEEKIKATLSIHWTVKGGIGSKTYASALQSPQFDFTPDCSLKERGLIIDKFHIDCKNSLWGDYVERIELQDSFQNSII